MYYSNKNTEGILNLNKQISCHFYIYIILTLYAYAYE